MKRFGRYIIGLFFLLTAGCGPPLAQAPQLPEVPPPVAKRLPTEYTLSAAAKSSRPEWIDREPEDTDAVHHLVGLSEHHASERDAREDAMRDARKKFAEFTGVEVSVLDEMLTSLYGAESDVLDAGVSAKSRTLQQTDALVSRIKAKEFYWEKYRARQGEVDRGVVYKCWVLVKVPRDEYDRVQLWRQEKQQALLRQATLVAEAAEREAAQLLSEVRSRLVKAWSMAEAGDLLDALQTLQADWRLLDETARRWREMSDVHAGQVVTLQHEQGAVEDGVRQLVGRLRLDVGRFGAVCFLSSAAEKVLSAWVFYESEAAPRPVRHLPLMLRKEDGGIVARAVTDAAGRADFRLDVVQPGSLQVAIDAESGGLESMAGPVLTILTQVRNCLVVVDPRDDLENTTRNAVASLFAGPAATPLPARRVILGPVTYGETRQGGEFAYLLRRQLSEKLARIDGLEVVAPRERSLDNVVPAVRTRGIAVAGKPALGAASTQALIDGADAALEATYLLAGDEMRLHLALKQAGTDVLLAAGSASLPKQNLPPGIDPLPPPAEELPPMVAGSQPIRLEIASHLGDGQTYGEGESISYFVSLDQDAYLLLLYEDAEQNLIQILPNRYSGGGFYRAGSMIQVPDRKDPFEFTIAAPFGTERVWVFASSRPFALLPGDELENGLRLLHGELGTVLAAVRRESFGRGLAYGEARAVVTTVARSHLAAQGQF